MGFSLGGLAQGLSQGINTGLGAVRQYQQIQQTQAQIDAQQAEFDQRNEANAAGKAYLDQQQQTWEKANPTGPDGATPAPYSPSPQDIVGAYNARGQALAKAGSFKLFSQNEAEAAPYRTQVRNQAIDKASADFALTGDHEALAKAVYPAIFDGHDIQSITTNPAVPGQPETTTPSGETIPSQPAQPQTYTIKVNGNTQPVTVTGQQIENMVTTARMDPKAVANFEFQSRLAQAKADYDARRQIAVENVKSDAATKLQAQKDAAASERSAATNATSAANARVSAGGRVEAARVAHAGSLANANADSPQNQIRSIESARKQLADDRRSSVQQRKEALDGVFDPKERASINARFDARDNDLNKQGADLAAQRKKLGTPAAAPMSLDNGEDDTSDDGFSIDK